MLTAALLLAQFDMREDLIRSQSKGFLGMDVTDMLLVGGAFVLLIAALFSWAYFVRKRPTEQQHGQRIIVGRRHRHHRSSSGADQAEGPVRRYRVRRRRRRGHPDNLPRNPTLAEAGGLPPPRPEDQEPPPAPTQ
jgi:hypothetical protein